VAWADGTVSCWGWNQHRQLGPNAVASAREPVSLGGLESNVVAIAAGGYHTCALTNLGNVRCVGRGEHGQLGNDTRETVHQVTDVTGLSGPVSAIAAGHYFTCAVMDTNAMQCWGYNYNGQIGDGTNDTSPIPVTTQSLGGAVSQIDTGGEHTCAIVGGDALQCWGDNRYGQLGDGTTTDSWLPLDVPGLGAGVAQIAAGGSGSHTCVIMTGGTMKCWGHGSAGELGDGTNTSAQSTPVDVIGLNATMSKVTAGDEFTCAITSGGGVKCWGHNSYGSLGDATFSGRNRPVDVVGLRSGVVAIDAGDFHVCALTDGGAVKCWGHNQYGQVGDGTAEHRGAPTDVIGLGSGVVAISAGAYHSCALTDYGAVRCWGHAGYGQLGGHSAWSPVPVWVPGLGP